MLFGSLWLKSILIVRSTANSLPLFCPFPCLLRTNYSIIELQLVCKGFKFIFSTDVLPSNTAVIVGLVHLSFSRSILVLTVKRPVGVWGCVRAVLSL